MSSGKPFLRIVVQPKDVFRYRYSSENQNSSHGGMVGKNSTSKQKTYPTVKLENYDGREDVVVRASLYTVEETETPRKHVIDLGGKHCEDGVCVMSLKDDMTATFPGMSINNKKKDEVIQILLQQNKLGSGRGRRSQVQLEKEAAKDAKSFNMHLCAICFEAFDGDTLICEKVFSDAISNPKDTGDLSIVRLSSWSASFLGGQDIILLCAKVKKDDIQIHFYKDEMDIGKSEPIGFGKFGPEDVHHQYAIAFTVPQYECTEDTKVQIVLYQQSEKKFGSPRDFTYIFEDNSLRKRRRPNTWETENEFNVSELSAVQDYESSANVPGNTDEILRTEFSQLLCRDLPSPSDHNNDSPSNMLNMDFDYEIIDPHDILMNSSETEDLLSYLDSVIAVDAAKVSFETSNVAKEKAFKKQRVEMRDSQSNISKYSENILKTINAESLNKKNSSKSTLLHISTSFNMPKLLKHFLQKGGNPNIKNEKGDTCFHLAARNDLPECMKELCSSKFVSHKEVLSPLDALNYDGLASLHLSILNESKDCFALLLKSGADINIQEKKCGRTALQLAIDLQPSFVNAILSNPYLDVMVEDYGGLTSVHYACKMKDLIFEDVIIEIENCDGNFTENSLKFLKETYKTEKNILKQLKENINNKSIVDTFNEEAFTSNSVMDFVEEEPQQSVTKNASGIQAGVTPYDFENQLCQYLDRNDAWKTLGLYLGYDKEFVLLERINGNSSPTKCLLKKLQNDSGVDYIETLRSTLLFAKDMHPELSKAATFLQDCQ